MPDDVVAQDLTQVANTILYGLKHGCSVRWLENRLDQLIDLLQAGAE